MADNTDISRDDPPTPSQQSSSGGELNRDIGSRAELKSYEKGRGVERVRGQDDPEADQKKGDKTLSNMRGAG